MVLLLCFVGFAILVWSFRWLRSFRFDGFVLTFRVLVHANSFANISGTFWCTYIFGEYFVLANSVSLATVKVKN